MTRKEFFNKWDELVGSAEFIGQPDDDFERRPIRFCLRVKKSQLTVL